jgi:hypothetical protein
VLGRGGAFLGLAAAVVLTAGGVGAAVTVQPEAQPAPPLQTGTRIVTIIDAPPVSVEPDPTTTTTAPAQPQPAPTQVGGSSASATITVIIH